MSASYSIFIKSQYSLLEVKETLEEILHCSFKQSLYGNDEYYYTEIMAIGFNLFGNLDNEGYVKFNNAMLPLSQYNAQINFDYVNASTSRLDIHDWMIIILGVLADKLSFTMHCECIVIRNYSTVFYRFAPDEKVFAAFELQ